jgi:excinuclease ABC subunit C
MTIEEFELIKETMPTQAGVYKYIDSKGTILYVGKAKNLKKRISQYFVDNRQTASRIKMMVKLAERIEFTVVSNENDALILENGLIKEFQPKYNIRLKDDKTYPFIAIKKESYPRVFFTRKYIKDGSEYLGPYTSVLFAKEVFNTLKTIFPLRTCNLNLAPEKIAQKKYKVCLEYHIGNCNAPCVGFQKEDEYNLSIRRIREILKGKFSELKEFMQNQMDKSAENLEFESAEKWKQRILKLKDFETKSVIFNPSLHEILALNIYTSTEKKVINYLKVINGTVVATKSYEVETKLEETDIEIYDHVIQTLLLEHPDVKEVLVPLEVSKLPLSKRMTIPLLGDKKKLLDLCYINARSYAMSLVVDPKFQKRRSEFNILKELQDKLKLTELPAHIECFDNSNIQGTSPVSACVVFKGGKPAKKDYRHFHVKSVEGPNDFDTMKEVVYRRYKRMLDEGEELPNLIVVDGGKGQLSSAIESLDKLGISERVPIIGIAKRLEEIYFKNDPIPLYIDKKSPALKLIQHMRDEAHRFGITFHRQTRSKKMIGSQLDEIEGFGAKTIQKLYKKFKHIEGMRNAPYEELVAEIGQKRAEQLRSYFGEPIS